MLNKKILRHFYDTKLYKMMATIQLEISVLLLEY